MLKRNLAMLAGVVFLAIVPFVIHAGGTASFTGADGQAKDMIAEEHPDYEPWAKSLWKPPSAEIESLLFALQAALGAGLVGFYFGRKSAGKSKSGRD